MDPQVEDDVGVRRWTLRERWFLGLEEDELPNKQERKFEGGERGHEGESEVLHNGSSSKEDEDSGDSNDGSVGNNNNKKEEKSSWTLIWNWFLDDLRTPHLSWVKAVFFFQSASLVALYPYLTIHMRSLGFTAEENALVNASLPATDIFAAMAGMLADKMGNFRTVMSVATFLNGAVSLLILAVPKMEERQARMENAYF